MARIQHVAIMSRDPKELADFYSGVFGFKILGEADGAYWVTDGYVNLALLPHRKMDLRFISVGINHFGVTLEPEEMEGVYSKLRDFDIEPRPPIPDGLARAFAEDQFCDPQGNHVDVSTKSKTVDETGTLYRKNQFD